MAKEFVLFVFFASFARHHFFFFHGMSGNCVGTFMGAAGALGCAIFNSSSLGGFSPGLSMLPRHDEMRACKP